MAASYIHYTQAIQQYADAARQSLGEYWREILYELASKSTSAATLSTYDTALGAAAQQAAAGGSPG